jgi:hypothetical protein
MTADALDGDEVSQTNQTETVDDPARNQAQGHCEKHNTP